jgi:hypothetical protein
LVAILASKREIADPIASTAHARNQMLDLKSSACSSARGAFPAALFEQVFSDFVARQLALLILNACYFGVLL